MKLKLNDFLVVSDMDGTLLSDDCTISAANLETIRLFTSLGGRFSIATGRTIKSITHYKELVPFLSPVISSGGTVVYDVAADKQLQSVVLPRAVARRVLQDLDERFPELGMVVMGDDSRPYLVNPSTYTYTLFADEKMTHFFRPKEEVSEDWNKVLFTADPELLDAVNIFVNEQNYPGVYFVHTGLPYFELFPQGITKGSGLVMLCEKLNQPMENTIVIGDYYNDVPMFEVAGRSVAMANAPAEIRMMADEVTGSCNDGGVGQVLYKLIREYGE